MNTLVGNKLRTLRKNKGWSQEQTADYLHISQSAYARIESGESNSWSNLIEPICKLYEIEPAYLLEKEPILINNNQQGGNFSNSMIINQLSEKLMEQYDNQINDLKVRLEKSEVEKKELLNLFVDKLEVLITKINK